MSTRTDDAIPGRLTRDRLDAVLAAIGAQTCLDVREARLIKFTNNAVFRLTHAPVVVRIAGSATARRRTEKVVRVSRWLAEHDVPAVRLLHGIEQPVVIGGHLATLWNAVSSAGPMPTGRQLAAILRRFHALPEPSFPLPPWRPVEEVRQRLAEADGLDAADLDYLLERCDAIEAELHNIEYALPPGPIHGDATIGNLIPAPDGPVICDFDSTSIGPREWDLAPVAVGTRLFRHSANNHDELAEHYGFDVTQWNGFPAFELGRSSLAAAGLIDVLAEWKNEPDTEVGRIAFIGLIQTIKRHQQAHADVAGVDESTFEMEWLRNQIKDNLCAYGPELHERRQLAWIGMLMLGDLTLIDGIEETIGYAGQVPGVRLDVLYDGDVDRILVDLVAEHWERLCAHFGRDDIFKRLNSTSDRERRTVGEQRRHVMSALATVASRYPAIAEMLRAEADTDAALRQDRHFLLWAKDENRGDEGVLRALAAKLDATARGRHDPVLDSVLDRDTWSVSDQAFKAILTEDALDARPGRIYASVKLAAYAQLFPADGLSIAAFRDLETWFRTDRATRGRRGWADTLAIAFGAADPQDLPAITTRAHTRIRMGMSDLCLPAFTKPLMRRLQVDADAAEAFKAALREPMNIPEDSPIFADPWDPIADACSDLQPLQRMYLFALVLRRAGALPQQNAAAAAGGLATASPSTVVHNPFTNHEGPLRLAVLDLGPH